ncbi:hypothetical protein Cyan10605_1209 [Cyanobacterium aponinum PCC 10605]|uniref:O-GlcNAc transferase C-terminal domain-containing protein n=2 Tax=Cyanobacterium TaxID=102234 RepID=K9Z4L1_CYAAP|nr:hypothetical protein Cyan10605_1209 [Cyanobacterium aponinum PCC 10605]
MNYHQEIKQLLEAKKYQELISYLEDNIEDISQNQLSVNLFWDVIPQLLLVEREKALPLLRKGINFVNNIDECVKKLDHVYQLSKSKFPDFSIQLLELCIKIKPNDLYLEKNLTWHYLLLEDYQQALTLAQQIYTKADNLGLKVYLHYLIFEVITAGGMWDILPPYLEEFKINLYKTIESQVAPRFIEDVFVSITPPLIAREDNLSQNRFLQNQIAKLFTKETRAKYSSLILSLSKQTQVKKDNIKSTKKLKIGYISSAFRHNPVGYLSRWLLKYYDRDKFEVFIYLMSDYEDEITQQWFFKNATKYRKFPVANITEIVNQISQDELDILVDLDCLTNHRTSQVMTFKLAPIQASCLGLDSTGIPTIDYFIADSFVLPDNAQTYYQEKIWRLPNCYLAVDGFESGTPRLLSKVDGIVNEDAIIYWTIQTGWKKSEKSLRLQLKILKQVDNSYLFIQCNGNDKSIKKIVEQEGVDVNRIKLLPFVPLLNYRANFFLTNILLDNYPFNGATSTLDALWLNIPLVTRVGEQFHARQGYTFLKNLGITEGIAYTDEEYIQWGVKFGTDEELRKKVYWKLRQSKKTSPLWDAKQFTRDMEKAYQQMWEIYVSKQIKKESVEHE